MVKSIDSIIEQLKDVADNWNGIDGTTNGQMVAVSRYWLRNIAYELDQAAKLERCKSIEVMGITEDLERR